MTEYILDDESTSTRVVVDDKTLLQGGDPVSLTKEQKERLEAIDGVVLSQKTSSSGTGSSGN